MVMNKGLLVLVLISPAVTSAGFVSEEPVYIPDASLKAAIERRLGISEPNRTEMLNLTYLRAVGVGIAELTGLECATNLTELYLKDNEIGDISPLKTLVNLRDLNLSGNQISDISALSGLKKMVSLSAADNLITDISALYRLGQLNDVDLSGNRIRELPELSKLPHNEAILLYNNEIEDIRGIYESHILDHRTEVILWEGNRDPNITPPALYVRDKDDNPVVLPETVRDKIYEVTLDFFYQNNFFEMLKPQKFSDLFGGVICYSIPGNKELTLYSYYLSHSYSRSVLIVYDPNTDTITADPVIYSHGNLNMDMNIPKSLASSFFKDINLDGNSEIIAKRGEHYGTQVNSIYHTYYHIGTDLSLTPIICLEAWQSTAWRVPYAERGTYYNVVRYIEPVQPNLVIVHTTLSLDPYEIGDEEAGFVVLESQNASSPFEVISRTVLMERYKSRSRSDSFLEGKCRR
jgi:hypothetical protein